MSRGKFALFHPHLIPHSPPAVKRPIRSYPMPDLGNGSVFSQTDASNNSGTMPSWSGSAAPSTLDDAGRAFQGAVTREWNWRSYTLTAGGTADAKTLSFSVAPAAYYNGQRFAFIANTTNTTTATLNVNSLGAKTIKKDVSGTLTNLTASEMVSGMFIEVAYNTANDCFVWVNRGIDAFPAGSASAPSITTNGDANTGFWFPAADTIAASTGGTERWRVTSGGDVGIGNTPGTKLDVTGGMRSAGWSLGGTGITGGAAAFAAGTVSTDSNWGMYFRAPTGSSAIAEYSFRNLSDTERLRIDASGNVLNVSSGGLGYGTGSGGGVTQLTSKTTAVTVNKTNGYILTSNSALGGGASATFTVSNSTFAASDNVVLNSTNGNYSVRVANNNSGSFTITLKNETGGSLSDAVQIQFAIIKSVFA